MNGDGISKVFGGSCAFRNDDTGALFIGVWGKRNSQRFRNALRQAGLLLEIVRECPPARLVVSSTTGIRSPQNFAHHPETATEVLGG